LQYEWLVRQAIRTTRADGTPALTSTPAEPSHDAGLFATALLISGDESDMAAARKALPSKSGIARNKKALLPEVGDRSEWASTAVLRCNWRRKSPALAVIYKQPQMQIELQAGGATLLSGEWRFECTVDGESLEPVGGWEEVCWHADDDVDYLELELELSNGWQVQRSLLLAREDEFLLVADAVLGPSPAQYTYKSEFPLHGNTHFKPESETHEGFLHVAGSNNPDSTADSTAALVMPLALPEWRDAPDVGALGGDGASLALSQRGNGARFFTPLLFDFGATATSAYTWRRLTVAGGLAITPDDVAVGYRARRNAEQWAFYRSLAEPANRTVLGENIICEFFAIRLEEDGSTKEIISVG